MAVDIDSLQIEIEATSGDAASKIDQLATALTNLKSAAKGGAGLTSVTKRLREIVSSASGASDAGRNISQMVSALKGLSQIKTPKGLSSLANQLNKLKVSVSGANGSEIASAMTALSNGVRAFSNIGNVKISSSIANQLNAIKTAVSGIKWTDGDKIEALANGLRPLSQLGKAQLTTFVNQLSKLPSVIEELDKSDLDKFATQMERVAQAMAPLATEMQKVANGFSAFPSRIQKIIQSNTGLAASNNKTAKSFGVLGTGISSTHVKLGVYLIALRQAASVMSNWVKESNDYVENLNLFTVAMGDYAEEAKAYAEEVQAIMGIDSSEWMRNQGVFMQMASGFGVASDSAALMSKNLTQLGYDISSFYNISIEDAMQKLQSGMAGEIEPLRRLGYAIDVATLQQVALNHGITESVNSMSQAEKSQLRYIAIMEQSTNAMGDLSRTIQTPANAMRILNQQITQLSRALGNLLIPFLQTVIPWVQAFVEVLTDAINALARLVGFELPTIDYSGMDGVTSGATDVEDAITGATDAAKEMKRELLGIDELTILEPPSTGGTAGVTGGVSNGDLGLELPEYDFLGDLQKDVDGLKETIEGMADEIIAIGAGFAAWKIAPKVLSWFNDLKNGRFNKIDKLAAGIGLVVTGFTLEWQGGYDIGYNGPNFENVLKTAIGSALGIAGSLLIFGTGPIGWTIGIVAALTVAIASISIGYNRKQVDDEIRERFGEIELTVEEAKQYAETIMSSPLSIQIDMYIEAKTTADEAVESFLESSENFSYLVWKVSVGFDVDEAELTGSIDSMISDAQNFLSAQKEVYTLAINIGFSDENIKSEMANFVNAYFAESSSEMERLGTELKQTMLNALSDGIIDEQEMKTISDLQAEVNQMVSAVADAEYKAKLTNTVYELDGDLSYESVKSVSEELNVIAQEQIDALGEQHLDALALIELKYQTDGNYEEYTAAIEDEMNTYFANKAQVSATAFKPLIEKFNSAFSDSLSEAQPAFDRPVQDLIDSTFKQFTTDETGVLVEGSISDFMRSVTTQWRTGFETMDVTPEVKQALSETLAALEPTAEQLEKIAEDSRTAGVTVPEYVSEGLHDYNMLRAITGDLDAINYLLGEKLSTDPNFLTALQTATDAGKEINASVARGLLDNVQIKQNADGTISLINDAIGEKVLQVTPEIVNTLKALGVDLSTGLINGVNGEKTNIKSNVESTVKYGTSGLSNSAYNEGYNIGKQIGNGIARGINVTKTSVNKEASGLVNSALLSSKRTAGIHSPSTLFRDEIGLNIGLGISLGIQNSEKYILSELYDANEKMRNVFSGETYNKIQPTFSTEQVERNVQEITGAVAIRTSDDSEGKSMEVVNAIYAMTQRIVTAIEENGGDIYVESDGTATQNRRNRMYGKTLQYI